MPRQIARKWLSRHAASARVLLTLTTWLATGAIASPSLHAQTLKLLHTFAGAPDGAESTAGLIKDKLGNLYGTTSSGGSGAPFGGAGTVFKIDTLGKETVLYNFCPEEPCVDGSYPLGGLIIDNAGNLYGTTNGGGAFQGGTVFEITAAGQETVLYSFGLSQGDGSTPGYGRLWRDSGGLFGTTQYGGTANAGTIWQLDPMGNETVLRSFTGADGANPVVGVVRDLLGNIYGTTPQGGSKGCGVLFQYVPGPHQLNVLHDFCTTSGDGSAPVSGLLTQGNVKTNTLALYGTTLSGGTNGCGTVYKMIILSGLTTLHNFGSGSDGCLPTRGGSLIFDLSQTILYGTTLNGGAYGNGVVYQVGIDGSNEVVKYDFTGGTDGGLPYGTLLRKGHNLLGTTSAFGGSNWGTVFKLVLP